MVSSASSESAPRKRAPSRPIATLREGVGDCQREAMLSANVSHAEGDRMWRLPWSEATTGGRRLAAWPHRACLVRAQARMSRWSPGLPRLPVQVGICRMTTKGAGFPKTQTCPPKASQQTTQPRAGTICSSVRIALFLQSALQGLASFEGEALSDLGVWEPTQPEAQRSGFCVHETTVLWIDLCAGFGPRGPRFLTIGHVLRMAMVSDTATPRNRPPQTTRRDPSQPRCGPSSRRCRLGRATR